MSLTPGATLGAYRIISSIGTGGMGEVFRAHDARLGRDVALKVLPDTMAGSPAARERFEREARAVAALNHPHIVTIYSTEHDGEVRFMTMELVEGQTLDRLIPAAGLPLPQFFDIAIALADALQAAHQKHITHRDLKPSNVMLTGDGRVKVLDFGLSSTAEALDANGATDVTRAALTLAGTILGTAPYMSPEQIEAKPLDHRSDLFSLGIMLYEMAGGRRPFGGDSSAALMSSILRDRPKPLIEVRAQIPAGVSRLVGRCLEKPVRERIQSAQEILTELKGLRKAYESGQTVDPAKAGHHQDLPPAARISSIAVLPFTDMSPAQDQDWFCDGIAEEILNALSQLSGLKVAARASAFSFKGKNQDLATIGEKLNVTSVLDGSVRRAGNRVRITVQLNQIHDGFQLWSERYDRELEDIFDVQDEIARAVAARLRVTLTGNSESRLVPQATANIAAYQLYLKGRSLLYRRGANVAAALEHFQRAVELDPDYALAWAGIADVFIVFGYYGAARPDNVGPLAVNAAARAVQLDPNSAEAHTAMAGTMLFHQGDWAGAEREFQRAIELNPHYVQARAWYALFFLQWSAGRFDDGVAEARLMHAIDPLSSYTLTVMALALGTAGLHDEAIAVGRLAVAADPQSFLASFGLAGSLNLAGRQDESVAMFRESSALSKDMSFPLAWLAHAYSAAGRIAEARDIYRRLVDRAATEYVAPSQLALAALASDYRDQAVAAIRAAWNQRDPFFVAVTRYHPHFQWFWEQDELRDIARDLEHR